MLMRNNDLIEKLSNLQLQENALKRALDKVSYKNKKERARLFDEIKKTKKQEQKVKFSLRLRREMYKNEHNNSK